MKTLLRDFERRIQSGDCFEAERALADAEEAHYMDSSISYEQFMRLSRLFQEVTGDHSILNHHT